MQECLYAVKFVCHHGVLLWSGRSRVWNDSNFHCYVGLNVFGEGTIVGHSAVGSGCSATMLDYSKVS